MILTQTVLVGLFFGGAVSGFGILSPSPFAKLIAVLQLRPYIDTHIQKTRDEKYEGIDDTGLFSLVWNFVMVEVSVY